MSECEPQDVIEVDYAQDDFLETIAAFQEILDEIPQTEEPDEDELERIKDDIELLCPYIDKLVVATGNAFAPYFEDGEVASVQWYEVSQLRGVYQGVDIMERYDEEGKRTICIAHRILLGVNYDDSMVAVTSETSYYARLEATGNIMVAEEVDDIFCIPDLETAPNDLVLEQLKVADYHSAKLRELLRMEFFKDLEPEEQFAELDRILEISEEAFGLRGMYMGVHGFEKALSPVVHKGKLRMSRHSIAPGQPIRGVCLGLALLNRIPRTELKHTHYTDFPEEERGLCVVIDPDDDLRATFELEDNSMLYIPLA